MTVLVGGVSQLYQGDLDVGRIAVHRLEGELGPEALVEDLHYGAVAVAQRLQELRPDAFVLVGAEQRGRQPGSVERRRIVGAQDDEGSHQDVGDAITGYVTMELAVRVPEALGALPARTVAIEIEPASVVPAESLTPAVAAALEDALILVRNEVARTPLLQLTEELRPLTTRASLEPSPALDSVRALLGELERLDRSGEWGRTFALRDRLRAQIAAGDTGYGMDHRDWALWWGLIEELDRLQAAEGAL